MTTKVKPLDSSEEPALRSRTQRALYCNVVQTIKVLYTLFCVVACIYYVYLVLNNFLTYPTILKIWMNTERELVFPAVTLCNLNRIKYSSLQSLCTLGNVPSSMLTLCESIKQSNEDGNISFDFPQSSILTPRIILTRCSEMSNVMSIEYGDNFRNIEIVNVMSSLNQSLRHQLGHQGENFITSCLFMGKSCSHSNFTTTNNIQYGNCYTFNLFADNPHEEKPFKAIGGSIAGLHVELNLETWEHITEYSEVRGARVVIHSPYVTPNIANNGFNIMPGTLTSVGLEQTLTRRSPKPYVDQCDDTRDNNIYTRERCVEECLQKLTLDKCGCCDPTSFLLDNSRVCNLSNETEVCCMDEVLTDLNFGNYECDCPLPCLEIHYHAQISSAQLVPRHSSSRTDVQNQIKLCVYYRNTDTIELNSIPKNNVDGTLSNIGGIIGLWLGASALSIFTFIPQIVKMIRRFVSPKEFREIVN